MTTLSNWILRAQFGLSLCYDAWIRLHGRVKINHFWKKKLDASNVPGFIWDSCGYLPAFSRVAVSEEVREGNSYISLVKLATKRWSGKLLGDLEKKFLVSACPGHSGMSDHLLCDSAHTAEQVWDVGKFSDPNFVKFSFQILLIFLVSSPFYLCNLWEIFLRHT